MQSRYWTQVISPGAAHTAVAAGLLFGGAHATSPRAFIEFSFQLIKRMICAWRIDARQGQIGFTAAFDLDHIDRPFRALAVV
jgi:hypothetical protein